MDAAPPIRQLSCSEFFYVLSWCGSHAGHAGTDFRYSKWIVDTFRKVGLCPSIGGTGRAHAVGPALDKADRCVSVARIVTDDLGLVEFDAASRAVGRAGVPS